MLHSLGTVLRPKSDLFLMQIGTFNMGQVCVWLQNRPQSLRRNMKAKKIIFDILMRITPIKLRIPLRKFIRGIRFKGDNRYCRICNSQIKQFYPVEFANFDNNSPFSNRNNAICPICGSIERMRLIYIYIIEKTNLFLPVAEASGSA